MKNLIILQLRKSFLSFGVILAAVLASAPLALAVKAGVMAPREAVNLAMLYWAIVGIPLTALVLSGIAGAEAASEEAKNTEQPLPVSQYGLLLSSLAAVLLELAVLLFSVWALLGFSVPLASLTAIQSQVLHLYVFSILYLVLYGFTFSYIFRNGIAGAALAVTALVLTIFPVAFIADFQESAFTLIPMKLLEPGIVLLAVGGGALALKLLSDLSDRERKRTVGRLTAIVILLAAPSLASLSALVKVNLAAMEMTLPLVPAYQFIYSLDKYDNSLSDLKENSGTVLVYKPFNNESFFLDKDGNRFLVEPGGARKRVFPYLFPYISFKRAQITAGPSGEVWIFYYTSGTLYSGSLKTGFRVRGNAGKRYGAGLLGGKEPGLLDRRDDGYYYASLPPGPGRDGLEWKKVSSLREGAFSFMSRKYYREGGAAAFRKDGKTLERQGKRWVVPDAVGTKESFPGIKLADGLNFLVPAKTPVGYATYLCRPDGRAEIIWPDYFNMLHNTSVTTDGTVWGIRMETGRKDDSVENKTTNPEFYVLTADGAVLTGIVTDGIVEKTGVAGDDLSPLRARGGYLWFNAGDKYLVKLNIGNSADLKLWPLPKIPRRGEYIAWKGAVSGTLDGIFITAADGVYFMDWEGVGKRIY